MTQYLVDGMTCGGCADSVIKAIKVVAPDAEVTVSVEQKTVTVEGTDDDAAIAKAVENAGFEFRGQIA